MYLQGIGCFPTDSVVSHPVPFVVLDYVSYVKGASHDPDE